MEGTLSRIASSSHARDETSALARRVPQAPGVGVDSLRLRRQRRAQARCGASLWRSGAERADCLAVLGLAAASRNPLRSLRSLCSDNRDGSDDERAARWLQALCSSAPQRRAAPGPRPPLPPSFWRAGDGGHTYCFDTTACTKQRTGEAKPPAHQTHSVAAGRVGRGRFCRGAEEHSTRVGARSAFRHLTHRSCSSGAPTGRAASSAMRPGCAQRRTVGAFSARPPRHEALPGTPCRDARQGQHQRLCQRTLPLDHHESAKSAQTAPSVGIADTQEDPT